MKNLVSVRLNYSISETCITRQPAFAAIGNPDLVPSIGFIEKGDFSAFVKDKKVDTAIVGRTFHRHGWRHNDGVILFHCLITLFH